ncbi:MAG: beta-ketoacyl synthase N-terminal-like domain-containing protein [Limnohabitans sp.]|nr:beta-ketoacyl synthase N-terminal-like domain-containing protein [Limnohabitans sp.]
MRKKIAITACASISALGDNSEAIWNSYLDNQTKIQLATIGNQKVPVSQLSLASKTLIEQLRNSDSKYKSLDNSVLYAMLAAREAVKQARWTSTDDFGINIGSSRGATEIFEIQHQNFIEKGKVDVLTSPTTTLGNISSWVAHDLKAKGPDISHSITCSTALHALLNGVAWLQSGMCDKFLVGGSEAPLTAFTIAQMQALKIYSKSEECCALDLDKQKSTMVLGEGASMLALENDNTKNALAYIEGIGYATDVLEHGISISTEAECFQRSIKMALKDVALEEVDVIVMHAPGTVKGDLSEYKAIQKVFGDHLPMLTTNKWKLGHTFGASGTLSVELAIMMLQHNQFIPSPYFKNKSERKELKKILVNAVGFGGNAVSVLISA